MPLESNANNVLDVPRRSGILSERELHITEGYDVRGLLAGLAGGEMTAVEVTAAFSKRAAVAQQVVRPCEPLPATYPAWSPIEANRGRRGVGDDG